MFFYFVPQNSDNNVFQADSYLAVFRFGDCFITYSSGNPDFFFFLRRKLGIHDAQIVTLRLKNTHRWSNTFVYRLTNLYVSFS